MLTRCNCGRATLSALMAVACLSGSARAQSVTGHWDFDAGDLRATVGRAGSYYLVPTPPAGNTASRTSFGTTTSFGIPDIGGTPANVMRFDVLSGVEGYAMFPEIDANGGGAYVNQYTVIYDILYPSTSSNAFISFLQTNECNSNDQDLAGRFDSATSSWGIGISGSYAGQIMQNTWHRVAFSVDLANAAGPTLDKYIDGVLVGSQILGSGLDGRWSLFTRADALPTLLLADNDGDVDQGYVNSIQIRDRALSAVEVAALGGASAAGIPTGPGVTGQWDFNAANLGATVGRDLVYFDGCPPPPGCTQNLAVDTTFGTADAFGIPRTPDGLNPSLMRWAATAPCNGYLFPHGALANGGGARVNQYTVIMDVLVRQADFQGGPWVALYQSAPFNNEDAMLWIRTSDGNVGDDGQYPVSLEFSCLPDTWLRIVGVLDTQAAELRKYVIRSDATFFGVQTPEGLDGKRTLWTRASAFAEDIFLAFTDDDNETLPGYVNCIQIRDYAMSDAEVQALGPPTAAGIPIPQPVCPGDLNGDRVVNESDLGTLLASWQAGADGDLDGDGDTDESDLGILLANWLRTCP